MVPHFQSSREGTNAGGNPSNGDAIMANAGMVPSAAENDGGHSDTVYPVYYISQLQLPSSINPTVSTEKLS